MGTQKKKFYKEELGSVQRRSQRENMGTVSSRFKQMQRSGVQMSHHSALVEALGLGGEK